MNKLTLFLAILIFSQLGTAYIVSNFATPENETVNFIIRYVPRGKKLLPEPMLDAFKIHYAILFSGSLSGNEFTILACDFKNDDLNYGYDTIYYLNASNVTGATTMTFNFSIPSDRKIICFARDDGHNKAIHAIATPSESISFDDVDTTFWVAPLQASGSWKYVVYRIVEITSTIVDLIMNIIEIIVLMMTYVGTSFIIIASLIWSVGVMRSQLKKAKRGE